MDKKNLLISGLVVFVTSSVVEFGIHEGLLRSAYEATADVWRSRDAMASVMPVMYVGGLLWAFLFAYVFSWMRKGNGVMEGVQYGFCIALFTMVPMTLGNYTVLPIPASLAIQWIVYGTLQLMICGAVLSMVYRPAAD